MAVVDAIIIILIIVQSTTIDDDARMSVCVHNSHIMQSTIHTYIMLEEEGEE